MREKLTLWERGHCQLWLTKNVDIPEELKRKFARVELEDKRRLQNVLKRLAKVFMRKGLNELAVEVNQFQFSQTIEGVVNYKPFVRDLEADVVNPKLLKFGPVENDFPDGGQRASCPVGSDSPPPDGFAEVSRTEGEKRS